MLWVSGVDIGTRQQYFSISITVSSCFLLPTTHVFLYKLEVFIKVGPLCFQSQAASTRPYLSDGNKSPFSHHEGYSSGKISSNPKSFRTIALQMGW